MIDTWTDPVEGEVTAPITAFNGTPWYINDLIEDEPGNTGIIYFMVLGDDEGPGHHRGITGLVPKNLGDSWFIRREANGVIGEFAVDMSGAVANIDVPFVPFVGSVPIVGAAIVPPPPVLPTVDTWVSWPTGIAMGSQGSLSILRGFALVSDLTPT